MGVKLQLLFSPAIEVCERLTYFIEKEKLFSQDKIIWRKLKIFFLKNMWKT